MTDCSRLLAILVFAALPFAAANAQTGLKGFGDDQPTGDSLVSLELASTVTAIRPGDHATLAVTFNIQPKWHIYWHNSGDSGAGPEFEWTQPEGISIGDPIWPVPQRKLYFDGDALDYIYEDTVTIVFPVSVSGTVTPGEHDIKLDAFWLVCKDVCLAGEGSETVSFTVSEDHTVTDREVESLVSSTISAAPSHIDDDDASYTNRPALNWRWTRNRSNEATVAIRVPEAKELTFYPHRAEGIEIEREPQATHSTNDRLEIIFVGDLKARNAPLRGVLVVTDADGNTGRLLIDLEPGVDRR